MLTYSLVGDTLYSPLIPLSQHQYCPDIITMAVMLMECDNLQKCEHTEVYDFSFLYSCFQQWHINIFESVTNKNIERHIAHTIVLWPNPNNEMIKCLNSVLFGVPPLVLRSLCFMSILHGQSWQLFHPGGVDLCQGCKVCYTPSLRLIFMDHGYVKCSLHTY